MTKKILIAEDDPDIVEMVQLRLEANGYDVLVALDGEECLNKIKSEKPDLMLLDVKMPKIDGFGVLIAMKEAGELDQGMPQVPVIILSASVNPRMRELIEHEEIADYMLKPFKAEELLAKIKRILGVKILLADDEEQFTKAMATLLRQKGYAVDVAFDGRNTLHLVKTNDYDFVFVDYNMPEHDGLEVAKYVKENKFKAKVIMLTGYTEMEDFFAKLVGVDEYIEKPAGIEAIEEIIKKYTQQS